MLLCFYTHIIVLAIIVTTHLGQEKGNGLILNYAAAVILIEFDNIAAKLYVKIWDNSNFNKFLEVQISKKVFSNPEFIKTSK